MGVNNSELRMYVCDLANEFYEIDNKSIPLGAGYVAAYCQKRFGNQVEVKVFRTFKEFWLTSNKSLPDVVGFGSYDWNYYLTLKAAEKIKKLNPKCVVVMGGANAEVQLDKNEIFLKNYPQVDFLVYGDGEYAFSNISEKIIRNSNNSNLLSVIKQSPLDGVRTLVNGKLIAGKDMDPVMNLDDVPSPYLTGLFDDYLKNDTLMPIIQSTRGCPYDCRYCVSGTQFGKIRHFSLERVKEEIKYLRKKAVNRFLRFSDDNFGITERDLEIAEYIRRSFDEFNYPAGLKAYSAKKQNDRTRMVATILKPLMPYCISLQTITPHVLKNTKRVSASHKEIVESLEYARKHSLPTATELIFGLPGETLSSWKKVLNMTIGYRFDSIEILSLWLLRGSELNRTEVREEMEYKSKFMLAENAITMSDDFFSNERDEIAVQSKYYTFDDWKVCLKYQILIKMLLLFGYGREIIYYALNLGIQPTDLFDTLIQNPEKYKTVGELTSEHVSTFIGNMFDSEEDLNSFIKDFVSREKVSREDLVALGKSRGYYRYLVKHFFDDESSALLKEICRGIVECYKGENKEQIQQEIDVVLDLTLKLIINPKREFVPEVIFESVYDIVQWVKDGQSKPLAHYLGAERKKIVLSCRNSVGIEALIKKDKEQGRTDGFHFFRYMNSDFMRRYVDKIIS